MPKLAATNKLLCPWDKVSQKTLAGRSLVSRSKPNVKYSNSQEFQVDNQITQHPGIMFAHVHNMTAKPSGFPKTVAVPIVIDNPHDPSRTMTTTSDSLESGLRRSNFNIGDKDLGRSMNIKKVRATMNILAQKPRHPWIVKAKTGTEEKLRQLELCMNHASSINHALNQIVNIHIRKTQALSFLTKKKTVKGKRNFGTFNIFWQSDSV